MYFFLALNGECYFKGRCGNETLSKPTECFISSLRSMEISGLAFYGEVNVKVKSSRRLDTVHNVFIVDVRQPNIKQLKVYCWLSRLGLCLFCSLEQEKIASGVLWNIIAIQKLISLLLSLLLYTKGMSAEARRCSPYEVLPSLSIFRKG